VVFQFSGRLPAHYSARYVAQVIADASGRPVNVALARSLFRQGASFTAAMAFEIASTNLVVELGIIAC
jgi:uncharacterized protein